jgi:hypothetical protein
MGCVDWEDVVTQIQQLDERMGFAAWDGGLREWP